ncbi:transposase [Dyadobacter endophyticus]|uniref:Transposase n=1 Tax=Dyadobacter endophyticus TaxID=1749036 RepID=A0ABQ1Z0V3_9BACT|nr:phage integrase SAM-like domain-containing protein [Dyadobacter endophyticus]GGH43004.1 transposase [Dyadobacter endophyticus]
MITLLKKIIKMRTLFVLRKTSTNKAGVCPVNCRITIDGIKATEFSVGVSVDPKKWDSKVQRVKGNSTTSIDTNRHLEIVKSEINEIYLSARARGVFLSAHEVKDFYTGKAKISCNYSDLNQRYRAELEGRGRAKSTLNRYRRCFDYLGEFLKNDLPVSRIERRHVAGFWMWLSRKGFHSDYCNKIVQACIGMFRYAIREGLTDFSPFAGTALEWTKELDTTCLSAEELEAIKTHKWNDRLQRVADSFVFMCYTGLHISDYQNVIETDRYLFQGIQFMKIKRVKTGVEAIFPLCSEVVELIDKYGGLNKMPKISGQKSNDYLKLIASGVNIEKNLTNKIARKTFTDWCLNDLGIKEEVVASMLGHTTTRQVRYYGKIKERRILAEWKDKVEFA